MGPSLVVCFTLGTGAATSNYIGRARRKFLFLFLLFHTSIPKIYIYIYIVGNKLYVYCIEAGFSSMSMSSSSGGGLGSVILEETEGIERMDLTVRISLRENLDPKKFSTNHIGREESKMKSNK